LHQIYIYIINLIKYMKHEVIYRNMQYLVGHRIPETNSIDKKWLCM
jgi:hypothetical protein